MTCDEHLATESGNGKVSGTKDLHLEMAYSVVFAAAEAAEAAKAAEGHSFMIRRCSSLALLCINVKCD